MACLHRSPRVLVTVALDHPAAGGPDDIMICCPLISRGAVRAAWCYTAGLTKELEE